MITWKNIGSTERAIMFQRILKPFFGHYLLTVTDKERNMFANSSKPYSFLTGRL